MPQTPDQGARKPPGAAAASTPKPEASAPRAPRAVPPVAAAKPAAAQVAKVRPPVIAQKAPNPAPAPKPAAETPATPGLDPEAAMKLNGLAARLNTLDYFQILNIEKTATPVEIKTAFHRWSRAYHPDRFYQLEDNELKARVNEVYKRITEAYYILRDDGKRKAYLTDISGPERTQKLRFTEASELETKAAIRKEHDEQVGTHPKGRQFFQTGIKDFEAQRWAAAERNFKMALTFEPANSRYKEKLEEARQNLYQESKKAGDPFKIR